MLTEHIARALGAITFYIYDDRVLGRRKMLRGDKGGRFAGALLYRTANGTGKKNL